MKGLTSEEIQYLLAVEDQRILGYPPPPQFGPIKWWGNHKPCVSRNCGSPTYITYKKIPLCSQHMLRKINADLIELNIEE